MTMRRRRLALAALALRRAVALVNVTLAPVGYNFMAPTVINDSLAFLLVDTGSYDAIVYNKSSPPLTQDAVDCCLRLCLDLVVDETHAYYLNINHSCGSAPAQLRMDTAVADVTLRQADYLYVIDTALHPWNATDGEIGLSYNAACAGRQSSAGCPLTAFQALVANASADAASNASFGLDFRDADSVLASVRAANSSLQLGGLAPAFADDLLWSVQPDATPVFHSVMIANLSLCGAPLFGNFSATWPALIDTGAVCLSLPAEFYDNFLAWFDNDTVVETWAALPALRFAITGHAGETRDFLLPLATLVVDADAISDDVAGAPGVTSVAAGAARLCVLRGNAVASSSTGAYFSPPPRISFGALALRALYFAADFQRTAVGFADKLSPTERDFYANVSATQASCRSAAACVGQQHYELSANRCRAPRCAKYYFQRVDDQRMVCVYDTGAVVSGLLIIACIAALEILSFFVTQFSTWQWLQRRRAAPQTTTPAMAPAVQVDKVSVALGRQLTAAVDAVVVHLLGWRPRRDAHAHLAHQPPP